MARKFNISKALNDLNFKILNLSQTSTPIFIEQKKIK